MGEPPPFADARDPGDLASVAMVKIDRRLSKLESVVGSRIARQNDAELRMQCLSLMQPFSGDPDKMVEAAERLFAFVTKARI